MKWRLVAFDFDGVLADSYTCLPDVYRKLAEHIGLKGDLREEFVKKAIMFEDKRDAIGDYDRIGWWPELLDGFGISYDERMLEELLSIYWETRIKLTKIMDGAVELLNLLKRKNAILTIVAGHDGKRSIKRRRIRESGLAGFFDDIIITGEDMRNKVEALAFLIEKYRVKREETMFIDDKPALINNVNRALSGVTTVKMEFRSVLSTSWSQKCSPTFRISSLRDLIRIIERGE